MRHPALLVATLAALLAPCSPAAGQIRLGLAGGPTVPLHSLARVADPGFHGGLLLDVGLPLIPVGARGELMLQRLPGSAAGESYDELRATLNGYFDVLPLPLAGLYVTGGGGMYASRFDPREGASSRPAGWEPGFNVGLGAELNLFLVRPFVEARLHQVLGDRPRSFVPVSVGVFF
jgi:hypothetical protein